jgi:hypothetical protein
MLGLRFLSYSPAMRPNAGMVNGQGEFDLRFAQSTPQLTMWVLKNWMSNHSTLATRREHIKLRIVIPQTARTNSRNRHSKGSIPAWYTQSNCCLYIRRSEFFCDTKRSNIIRDVSEGSNVVWHINFTEVSGPGASRPARDLFATHLAANWRPTESLFTTQQHS